MSWFKSNRWGCFNIDADIIAEMPEVVQKVMGTVVVVAATIVPYTKSVAYTALSPHFDELESGAVPPTYDMSYDEETGEVTWTRTEG